jgi:3-oxoacyl-[acyl-carrier-protein] synthase-3
MHGCKIYEFALTTSCSHEKLFDKSGISLLMSKKNFIHQANEKMDEAIIQTFLQIV